MGIVSVRELHAEIKRQTIDVDVLMVFSSDRGSIPRISTFKAVSDSADGFFVLSLIKDS